MAVMNGGATAKSNGGDAVLSPPSPAVVDGENETESVSTTTRLINGKSAEEATLYGVFNLLIQSVFVPSPNQNRDLDSKATTETPEFDRIKEFISETAPLIREALRNTRRDILLWIRRGSPLRGLLAVSVGTVVLLALTGMLVFMLFFAIATVNAIVISVLISLAAVGGFLAIFFTCLTAIYIGVLCIGAFVTFAITISLIIAALVVAGWIGFIWMVWLAVTKSASLAKYSLSIAGQAFPANTFSQGACHVREPGELK